MEILRTVHGSRLYGTAHAGSDYDWYTVVADGRRPRQSIVGDQDNVILPYRDFIKQVRRGVPQACEALWSPEAVIHPDYLPFLRGIRLWGGDVADRHERTVRNFCYGDFKRRRHAVRMAWNLHNLRQQGWYYPRMSQEQVKIAEYLANSWYGDELAAILEVDKPSDAGESHV